MLQLHLVVNHWYLGVIVRLHHLQKLSFVRKQLVQRHPLNLLRFVAKQRLYRFRGPADGAVRIDAVIGIEQIIQRRLNPLLGCSQLVGSAGDALLQLLVHPLQGQLNILLVRNVRKGRKQRLLLLKLHQAHGYRYPNRRAIGPLPLKLEGADLALLLNLLKKALVIFRVVIEIQGSRHIGWHAFQSRHLQGGTIIEQDLAVIRPADNDWDGSKLDDISEAFLTLLEMDVLLLNGEKTFLDLLGHLIKATGQPSHLPVMGGQFIRSKAVILLAAQTPHKARQFSDRASNSLLHPDSNYQTECQAAEHHQNDPEKPRLHAFMHVSQG